MKGPPLVLYPSPQGCYDPTFWRSLEAAAGRSDIPPSTFDQESERETYLNDFQTQMSQARGAQRPDATEQGHGDTDAFSVWRRRVDNVAAAGGTTIPDAPDPAAAEVAAVAAAASRRVPLPGTHSRNPPGNRNAPGGEGKK